MATGSAAVAVRPGPGRPPTGARDRIAAAALEILKEDGYSGLTTAKVAARAGQNKALISYHFGGKQGLVAEVAAEVATLITDAARAAIADVDDVEQLARAVVESIFQIMDTDEGVQRVYFDLTSQAVVHPEIDRILGAMKARFRAVLRERLAELGVGPDPARTEAAAVFLIAGVQGLALERLERGENEELAGARELWLTAVSAALGAP
jgi:AcrR family transcriptional regulator